MKVVRVRTQVVNVPFMEPETWYFGKSWGLTSVVIWVETDDGLTGIGECPGVPNVAAAENAVTSMGEMLVGRDPRDTVSFVRLARKHGWHHFPYLGNLASAGLEMAMWDICGKAAGVPLHHLWGGLERATVPYYFYIWVPDRDPETARVQARDAVASGFSTLYFKIGFDLDADVALVRAVREEVGPDIALRVDANEGWSTFEAVDGLHAFEEIGLEFFEQPIDMHDLEGLRYLRQHTRTRIGANQSAWQPHQVRDVLARGSADVIVTDPHQLGGIGAFRDVAGMCETFGVPLVKHSFGDLGLTTAATLHTLGALHPPVLAHQTHLTLLEHDLLAEPFIFRRGSLAVPEAPGLGVELDSDAVAHYAELWTSVGELASYGAFEHPSPFGDTTARPDRRSTPVIAGA